MTAPEPSVNVNDLESLRAWLTWNDPHGIYADDDAEREGLPPLTLAEAQEIYGRQLAENGAR